MQEQTIKEKLKERYGKIALTANSDGCCAPTYNCSDHEMISSVQMAEKIGYDAKLFLNHLFLVSDVVPQ